ncbi:Putative F-box-like domain superfamily protein [Septoria linicola]|uniref:F-box-like domain superfamily protein n=1 Tax=Septoria linicola TaxID=215465 RepID=A0A9Q9ENM1_9PEZI|nr:Putative F-box-like domain superfamily protein [Septoria linicola]
MSRHQLEAPNTRSTWEDESEDKSSPCRPAQTQHPIHVIYNVPEQFKRVLLHMPIEDLILHAPRVCKEWKQMIDTSPSLQRGLFLRPVQEGVQSKQSAMHVRVAHPVLRHKEDGLGFTERSYWVDEIDPARYSWQKMYMSQPPEFAATSAYKAEDLGPTSLLLMTSLVLVDNLRTTHNDPGGLKLGGYGSTVVGTPLQPPWCYLALEGLSLGHEQWEQAETAADVLQILGVMDID